MLNTVFFASLVEPVLTSRMCDGLILDAKTQKGLGDANAIVNKLPAKK